jgi:hypothetical protein
MITFILSKQKQFVLSTCFVKRKNKEKNWGFKIFGSMMATNLETKLHLSAMKSRSVVYC